jgi:hypothetical protein
VTKLSTLRTDMEIVITLEVEKKTLSCAEDDGPDSTNVRGQV